MSIPGWNNPLFRYVVRDSWSGANTIASAAGGLAVAVITHFVGLAGGKMLSPEEPLRSIEIALIGFGAIWAVILLSRACWWPFHKRLVPFGGLVPFLRTRLGIAMWPVILMASGIVAFVVLFGAGAILFLIKLPTAVPQIAMGRPSDTAAAPLTTPGPAPSPKKFYSQKQKGELADLIQDFTQIADSYNSQLQTIQVVFSPPSYRRAFGQPPPKGPIDDILVPTFDALNEWKILIQKMQEAFFGRGGFLGKYPTYREELNSIFGSPLDSGFSRYAMSANPLIDRLRSDIDLAKKEGNQELTNRIAQDWRRERMEFSKTNIEPLLSWIDKSKQRAKSLRDSLTE